MQKFISSTQNPLIKECLQLRDKSRARKKSNQFLIEGLREVTLALRGGYIMKKLLVNTNIISEKSLHEISALCHDTERIELSDDVYNKLALRGSTEGVIAIAEEKDHDINSLNFEVNNPLILVAEAPEKPGNIGALLRTADAAGLDAVIIANPKTDIYNPLIVRTSVGCVFTTNIATGTSTEIIAYLKYHHIAIFGTALSASKPYDEIDFKQPSAIVVGTEASGLTSEWLENTDSNIIIPMNGAIDSLNVSVSAAVVIFEAVRQRKAKL